MLRAFYASVLPLLGRQGGAALSAYRSQKLERIKDPEQYTLSLGAELLLIEALKTLGPVELPLDIRTGPVGKPEIGGGPCFSLSHSGELVFCAVSDSPVGADVQRLGRYKPALARRFFTEEECRWLEQQRERALAFTSLWSLKESYVKFCGAGIGGVHLDSFTVRLNEDGQASIPKADVSLWYTRLDDYVMAVCSNCGERPEIFKALEL